MAGVELIDVQPETGDKSWFHADERMGGEPSDDLQDDLVGTSLDNKLTHSFVQREGLKEGFNSL